MAHQLHVENGRASMMYAGEVPWHGLGTHLNKPATADEAIVAARLDWEVIKRPRARRILSGPAQSNQNLALVRNDRSGAFDGAVLGYVDESYTPLQNREAFEFFDPIVGTDAAVYETAGALGSGERVWILARLPRDLRVAGDDLVAPYLLLANSHGGRGGVELRFTPVRVVCGNTLSLALHLSRGLRLDHTPDLHSRLRQAAWNLDEIKRQYTNLESAFRAMARLPMSGGRLSVFLGGLFPAASGSRDGAAQTQVSQMRDQAARLFETGRGNDAPAVRGTLWAAYNGVTELADYYLDSESPDARLRSIWFGDSADLKIRAYDAALSLLREERPRSFAPRRVRSLDHESQIEAEQVVVEKDKRWDSTRQPVELVAAY